MTMMIIMTISLATTFKDPKDEVCWLVWIEECMCRFFVCGRYPLPSIWYTSVSGGNPIASFELQGSRIFLVLRS